MDLDIGKSELHQGETTKLTLTVHNISAEAVPLRFSETYIWARSSLGDDRWGNQCRAPYGLFQKGTKVGGSRPTHCSSTSRQAPLEPGQSVQYHAVLDTLVGDWPRTEFVQPGRYDLFVGFDASTQGHPRVWYLPPAPVTVVASSYPTNSASPDPRIQLTADVEQTMLRQGDTSNVTLTLRNTSEESVDFGFSHAGSGMHDGSSSQCRAPYGLFHENNKVGGSPGFGCTANIGQGTLGPGESAQYRHVLDTMATEPRDEYLPPGEYDLFIGFDGGTEGHPSVWYVPPTTITILG